MADLKIVIGGDARQLQDELKKSQAEISKTAIEANKLDSSLKKTTASAGQSIFNLTEKLRTLQSSVFTEKDRLKIASYNKEIKNTEIEIAKLNALGTTSGGAGAFSGIASGAGKAFSAVRKLAYILPGVGIAGIIGFAAEPIAAFIGKLFEATEAEKKLAKQAEELKKFNEETAKNYGKEISTLEILRGAIESTTLPMAKRLQAIKDLKKEFPGLFDGLTNEQLLTGNVANAYNIAAAAILRKAKASAAASEIERIAAEKLKILQNSEDDAKKTNETIKNIKKVNDFYKDGFTIRNVTIQKQQEYILDAFNKRKKVGQDELNDLNKQQQFYLGIAIAGADQTIKVEEKKAEKIKKVREKSVKEEKDLILIALKNNVYRTVGNPIKIEPVVLVQPKVKNTGWMKDIIDEYLRKQKEFEQMVSSFQQLVSDSIKSTAVDAVSSIGEVIGAAIGGKGDAMKGIFTELFMSVGSQLQQLGKFLIQSAIKVEIAKKAFKKLLANPVAAIAVGIGLVALGALIKAQMSKQAPGFATGVRNFGGGTALVGERGPELVQLPSGSNVVPNGQLNAMSGGGNAYIMETVIRGQDLAVVLKRANQTISRNG